MPSVNATALRFLAGLGRLASPRIRGARAGSFPTH